MNFVEFLLHQKGFYPPLADKYGEWLGYDILEFGKGEATTTLTIRDEHLSPSAAVHGGVIAGFLDFSCGCAVFTTLEKMELCSTVDLSIKYFKPVRRGDVIIAKARLVHRGRSLSSVVADLFHEKDETVLLALATGTFNIYPIK